MLFGSVHLVFVVLLGFGSSEAAFETMAAAAATGDLGHGLQVVGKLVRQFINTQPEDVRLGDGVHLINLRSDNDARAAPSDDGTMLGAVESYLQTHELRIRLPELMPGEGFGRAFRDSMTGIQDAELGTPRGKGSKGGGYGGIALMGLMMGKMMAALGLGGVGLLAMKALMVSALALMLSMIIGLKKLVSSDHDDGGGHTVIHASHGGGGHEHRRKREAAADMAYHGWNDFHHSS